MERTQEAVSDIRSCITSILGIRLATAMATARAYNGEIKVENDELLNLTTFIIKLPVQT